MEEDMDKQDQEQQQECEQEQEQEQELEQQQKVEEEVPMCEVTPRLPCGCHESMSSWEEVKPPEKRTTRMEKELAGYLKHRHIPEFFNFLIGHLVAVRPDDPIPFLEDLLDRCLLYRDGLVDAPLLFDSRHINSMYKSLDPECLGYISLQQYAVGMRSMGIYGYNPNPVQEEPCNPDHVDRETFEAEAKRCLENKLKEMIRKPKICI